MQPSRICRSVPKRTIFSLARKSSWHIPPNPDPPIPQEECVDEEKYPGYKSRVFYPARVGEVLDNRYQLLVKAGCGSRSTVWLARDISRFRWSAERAVALKIGNSNTFESSQDEIDIEKHIASVNPSHEGYIVPRTCLDNFVVTSPEGKHRCSVYEPLREPLWLFPRFFPDEKLPLPLAKIYINLLLAGLDYLHTECKVVHTDLKLDNILMTFQSSAALGEFLEKGEPMRYKVDPDTGSTIYECHNYFGAIEWKQMGGVFPRLVDFGQAVHLEDPPLKDGKPGEAVGLYPIQPDHYRAPEGIIGANWNFKADIWNLGVMLWNMLGDDNLFQQVFWKGRCYDAKAHLAEMIGLLGPPPKELLGRADFMLKHGWPSPITSWDGKTSSNALEFFGGPFFDDSGDFLYKGLIPNRRLEHTVPFLEGNDKEEFLSFVRDMLVWHPAERKSARELMEHPFVKLET